MVPRTVQDVYNQKLLAGTHKPAIVSTRDESVEQEVQTEDLGSLDKFNQAPDDAMVAYKEESTFITKRERKDIEAVNLDKFMARAGPVMEQIIEENNKLRQASNSEKTQRTAVEARQSLQIPNELLVMLGSEGQQASILAVTAVHMFETAPQSKCAVAYSLVSPRNDLDVVHLIVVYSVAANQVLRILKSESEVTRMCTPADEQILIAGTDVGSLVLYDLTAFESAGLKQELFDYEALLIKRMEEGLDEDADLNHLKALKKIRAKFQVLGHTFSTDCMASNKHFAPIRQLQFVNKVGKGSGIVGAMDELGVISIWSVMEI